MSAKPKAPVPIPQVEAKPVVLPSDLRVTDADYTHGLFLNRLDGELYAVAKLAEDINDRIFKAKNSVHFWEGNEDEFRATFEKP